ncbi:hypothetical protein AKO1_010447 [Acrasis kona]|uniref:NACHT domain-containing protein n=1 Tax=Acrasis kona TaxID=1008807 RepID=A0AAW2ZLI3_9EUKA
MNNLNTNFRRGENNTINSGNTINQFTVNVIPKGERKEEAKIQNRDIQKKLFGYYKMRRNVNRILLADSSDISECFVNLTIIKTQQAKQFDKELEFNKGELDKYESLFQHSNSFPIKELFKEGSESHKRILITGQAGVGKSVLSQYIACQWSGEEELFRSKFDAVFWIKLRDLLINPLQMYGDDNIIFCNIINRHCFSASDKSSPGDLWDWLLDNKDRILFVLDGYDEVAISLDNPALKSFFSVLFCDANFQPYIIMTSRPMPTIKISGDNTIKFDNHLRCVGFIDKDIPEFVEKYFKQAKRDSAIELVKRETAEFVTFLRRNRNVWAISHVPVSLELLCYYWSKKKVMRQVTTLSSLYTDVVKKIFSTELEKNKIARTTLEIYKTVMCKLAYEAMKKQIILMSSDFVEEHINIVLKNNNTTGVYYDSVLEYLSCTHLIRSLDNGVIDKKEHDYFFVHQSFQEYFAACYIKQCFKNGEVPQDVVTFIKDNCSKRYYLLTWCFTSGILFDEQEPKIRHRLNHLQE